MHKQPRAHHLVLLTLATLGFLLTACAPQAKQEEPAPTGMTSSRHAMTGIVVSANAETKEAIIEHDEIPDVMGAMRMGFSVPEAADREKLQPGARIKATLVMENNTMWVEGVQVTGQGEVPASKSDGHHHH